MVTYCLGSARQKRAYFYKLDGAVVLDNDEVLFCASENGRNYFAYGEPPFGGFTVEQYIKYRTALCGRPFPHAALAALRISPSKRLEKLSPAQRRCVAFVEKTGGDTDSPIVINLDGARYTRKNALALDRLLALCKTAYVCVTDPRFVKRARQAEFKTLAFGKAVKHKRPAFYAAHRLAKMIGATRVAEF